MSEPPYNCHAQVLDTIKAMEDRVTAKLDKVEARVIHQNSRIGKLEIEAAEVRGKTQAQALGFGKIVAALTLGAAIASAIAAFIK